MADEMRRQQVSPVPERSAPAHRAAPGSRQGIGRLLRWDVLVTTLLIMVFVGGAVGSPDFATTSNLSFALDDISEIALIALPMTLLVVVAEVDLSVASMFGLSSALLGALWNAGWSIQTIIPLAIAVGAVGGLVNGLLVTKLGLPSLAVTIGTLTAYRGLAEVLLGSNAVAGFPPQLTNLATGTVPGTPVPYPIALFAVLAIVAAVLLHATGFGRSLFAVGAAQEAAFFAGIRVKRIKLLLFVAAGIVSAFAGAVYTFRYGSARADNGTGFELTVVAAVLLGGIDFNGGKGTLGGAVAGVLLIGVLKNLLTLHDASTEIQSIVTGFLLVVSVLTPRLTGWISDSRRRRQAAVRAQPA